MAGAKQVIAIEIDDCKIAKMTADVSSAPTYDTAIDVPKIGELTAEIQLKTATLEGDAEVSHVYSKATHVTGSIRFRSLPLDAFQVMTGASLTASGTTPNQIQTLSLGNGAKGSYFKIVGRSAEAEGLDATATGLKVTIWKAKLTGAVRYSLTGEYVNMESSYTAVRTNSDKKLMDIVTEETQTTIS